MSQPPSCPPRPNGSMTSNEYFREYEAFERDLRRLEVAHHTHEAIQQFARDNEPILRWLNREAEFWNAQALGLQTSRLIFLGRIFDEDHRSHSVHSLVRATRCNIHLFTTKELAIRRSPNGIRPEWMDQFIAQTWVPKTAQDLVSLKDELSPYTKRYTAVYRHLRDAIAHNRRANEVDLTFDPGTTAEVTEIVDFLRDFKNVIWDLFMNGNRPKFQNAPSRESAFAECNEGIRRSVRGSILRLLQGQLPD